MKFLAIDPGESTGWARFDDESGTINVTGYGILKATKPHFKEFYGWLQLLPTDYEYLVIESYIIKPDGSGGFSHRFDKAVTSQFIGAFKSWAHLNNIPVIEQGSDIKKPAHGWFFGTPYKKKPNQHAIDAICHGIYFQVKKLGVSPGSFRKAVTTSD